MKKLLTLLLCVTFLFSLTACKEEPSSGGEDALPTEERYEKEDNITEEEYEAATKTLAYFNKVLSGGEYTMEYVTYADGMEMKAKSAYKADMIYSESEYEGIKSVMIMKDGYQYIIDDSTKTCIKMQIIDTAAAADMFAEEAESYETALNTGTTEYKGKEYYYEEFELMDEKTQYLFDGNDLKIMKASVMGIESIVEIVSLEKGADSSLFEIPEDYQIITY